MGWRSDYPITREWATHEVLRKLIDMSDQELSDLVDYLNPDRTVNYRIKERENGVS